MSVVSRRKRCLTIHICTIKHNMISKDVGLTVCDISNLHSYYLLIKHPQVSGVSLNLTQMLKAKDTSVTGLTKGVEMLFKQNKVDYIKGAASFISPTRLSVDLLEGGSTEVEAKNIVIATGSEVSPFPGGGIEIDETQIVSSTGALELQEVPKKMVVIGGGIIGLEMGSVWSRLGAEVTVVEFLGAIGGQGIDEEIAKQFQKILAKQGLKFKVNTKVVSAEKKDGLVFIKTEAAKGGNEEMVSRLSSYTQRAILNYCSFYSLKRTSCCWLLAVVPTQTD